MGNKLCEEELIRKKVETREIGGIILGGERARALYYKLDTNCIRLIDRNGNSIDFPYDNVWVTFDERINVSLLGMGY